ncbi:MAG: hypothetical protein LBH93_04420 [Chitinispirillales bacterium]|jgi:hypothetical protein|nr:hypothetical protein [Chitinispirillales bacterium]
MLERRKIIVSMTSFPAAIPFAAQAVRSILCGSVKPDKVVLYLTFSQFPNGEIPPKLTSLAEENTLFEIRNYDDDIRSYRKLIPALIDFPNDVIVTVDDDVFYHKNMLRDLLRSHDRYPNALIAHRVKRLKPNTPYRKWRKYRWYGFFIRDLRPKFGNLQTGVGGVLYPPNSLMPEMLDPKLFTKMAPTTDDIWFWAAAVANGVKLAPVPFGHSKPRGVGKPRSLSLRRINVKSGTDVNRAVLESIFEKYPIIKERIENEK